MHILVSCFVFISMQLSLILMAFLRLCSAAIVLIIIFLTSKITFHDDRLRLKSVTHSIIIATDQSSPTECTLRSSSLLLVKNEYHGSEGTLN